MDSPRLSHIAIASPSIAELAAKLQSLALEISERHDVPSEKVTAAMIPFEVSPEVRIELLEPTTQDSPITKFLSKRPGGGLHHLAFEVKNLEKWERLLTEKGFEILPPGIRKAARGKALFIHPKSVGGVLVELEELSGGGH